MKSLSWENQADIIESLNSTSRYLDDELSTQSLLMAMLHSLIARRRVGPQKQ